MTSRVSIAIIALIVLSSALAGLTRTQESGLSRARNFTHSIPLNNRTLDTKTYLDQAWEFKMRGGLLSNSGFVWDPAEREWRLRSKLAGDDLKAVPYYASWTAPPAWTALNIAQAYGEPDKLDELAKFYSFFLKTYFTTLGELRKVNAPEVKQKLLGLESGPDSARTLAWYWKQSESYVLRECNLCTGEYFFPAAHLVQLIAALKPNDRTAAMSRFVADYVPLLAKEHVLRLNLAERMRAYMNPSSPLYKKTIMIGDEIFDIAIAAELLGARARDSKFVAIGDADLTQLKDFVRLGVQRFQYSQTLTKDSAGRSCASYFNGDWDAGEDMAFARYTGETFPTLAQSAKAQGASWDISHFSVVPLFLWSLFNNRAATSAKFPQKPDIEYLGNQFAFHVFEGDYKKPLFKNFFDGSDGWFRVNYSGRSSYGIAPSSFCNMFDPSHGCTTIGGIYSWSLLASIDPDIAGVQTALIDLARSDDPAIACFKPQCFRERYYHYAETSFSFLDPNGNVQYPPALIIVLSQLAASFSGSPDASLN